MMDILKEIGTDLLLIGFGVFGVGWQIFQWRGDTSSRLVVWIGIIPVPIGLAGLLCFVAGGHGLGKLMHLF